MEEQEPADWDFLPPKDAMRRKVRPSRVRWTANGRMYSEREWRPRGSAFCIGGSAMAATNAFWSLTRRPGRAAKKEPFQPLGGLCKHLPKPDELEGVSPLSPRNGDIL